MQQKLYQLLGVGGVATPMTISPWLNEFKYIVPPMYTYYNYVHFTINIFVVYHTDLRYGTSRGCQDQRWVFRGGELVAFALFSGQSAFLVGSAIAVVHSSAIATSKFERHRCGG